MKSPKQKLQGRTGSGAIFKLLTSPFQIRYFFFVRLSVHLRKHER